MSEKDTLIEALFKLYSDAGTEVTYVTDDGRTLAYWPKRYLQALRRAVDEDNVIGFVEGLVTRDASRGFGYLADAGRLDLTVEAVIVSGSPISSRQGSSRPPNRGCSTMATTRISRRLAVESPPPLSRPAANC